MSDVSFSEEDYSHVFNSGDGFDYEPMTNDQAIAMLLDSLERDMAMLRKLLGERNAA